MEPIDPATMAKLVDLPKHELLALIVRVAGATWGYALMSDEDKAEAARLKLYSMGMTATEVHKVVPALDKWFDRTKGKAPQSIALDVKDDRMAKMATDRLLWLAGQMREPVVVAPLPELLPLLEHVENEA